MTRTGQTTLLSVALHAAALPACEPGEPDEVVEAELELDTTNALTSNALTSNALTSNALTSNALTSNALTSNALTSNALTSNALATNAEARLFLQYAYGCAMPEGASATVVVSGVTIQLKGALGLAPQWGQAGGSCNTSCQRWVSACLIARTNVAGKKVLISARKPPSLNNNVHNVALNTPSPMEEMTFQLPEGAYYGNVFAKTTSGAPAPVAYACAIPGPINTAWAFTIEDIVTRICGEAAPGSHGCVLTGLFAGCELTEDPFTGTTGACKYRDSNGAYRGCYSGGVTEPPWSTSVVGSGTMYNEVITVYRADTCPHADFVTGAAMPAACSSCAGIVANVRPSCAAVTWDSTCVAYAKDLCGAHDVEATGTYLAPDDSACTTAVCVDDPYCCSSEWDGICVGEVATLCN